MSVTSLSPSSSSTSLSERRPPVVNKVTSRDGSSSPTIHATSPSPGNPGSPAENGDHSDISTTIKLVRKKKIKKSKSVDESGLLGQSCVSETASPTTPIRLPIMFDAEALSVAFSLLDTDSNGRLSLSELQSALSGMGVPDHVQESALMSFRDQVSNSNVDGMTYAEFMDWMPRLTTLHQKTLSKNFCPEPTTSKMTSSKSRSNDASSNFSGRRTSSTTSPPSRSSGTTLCPPSTSPTRVTKSNSLPSDQMLKEEEERDLRAAFAVFDSDGNGFISRQELKDALILLDESSGDVDVLLKQADIDCDGQISVEDFLLILSSSSDKKADNTPKT